MDKKTSDNQIKIFSLQTGIADTILSVLNCLTEKVQTCVLKCNENKSSFYFLSKSVFNGNIFLDIESFVKEEYICSFYVRDFIQALNFCLLKDALDNEINIHLFATQDGLCFYSKKENQIQECSFSCLNTIPDYFNISDDKEKIFKTIFKKKELFKITSDLHPTISEEFHITTFPETETVSFISVTILGRFTNKFQINSLLQNTSNIKIEFSYNSEVLQLIRKVSCLSENCIVTLFPTGILSVQVILNYQKKTHCLFEIEFPPFILTY